MVSFLPGSLWWKGSARGVAIAKHVLVISPPDYEVQVRATQPQSEAAKWDCGGRACLSVDAVLQSVGGFL